jgi:hypothetical protein
MVFAWITGNGKVLRPALALWSGVYTTLLMREMLGQSLAVWLTASEQDFIGGTSTLSLAPPVALAGIWGSS